MKKQTNPLNSEDIKSIEYPGFTPEEAFSLSACLGEYHRTFILLRQYDERDTPEDADDHKEGYYLEFNKANLIIKELKRYLAENGENTQNLALREVMERKRYCIMSIKHGTAKNFIPAWKVKPLIFFIF